MNDITWETIDWDPTISLLGTNSKAIHCQHNDLDAIILQEEYTTTILKFSDNSNNIFSTPVVGKVECKNPIRSIINVGNRIFMLDAVGDLHELVNNVDAFQEALTTFTSSPSASWCWKLLQHFNGGLAIAEINDGMALLHHVESVMFIETYKLNNSDFELESSKKLSYCQVSTDSYYLKSWASNEINPFLNKSFFHEISSNEIIIVGNPTNFTSVLSTCTSKLIKKTIAINFEKNELISVLSFKKEKCMLLIYSNGKMFCISCDESSRLVKSTLFLPDKVVSVISYKSDDISLIWSDGFELRHSKILNWTEVIDLEINESLKGIRHLLNFNDVMLGVTWNGSFYKITPNCAVRSNTIKKKSTELLNEIYEVGILMEKLNEGIKLKEDAIYALETSRIRDVGKKIAATVVSENEIKIQNASDRIFKKDLWRIKLETDRKGKKLVEMKRLDNDLRNESFVTVKTNFTHTEFLLVSLVCDCGSGMKLVRIDLPKIDIKQSSKVKVDSFSQVLQEIAKRRNQNFK